MCTNSRSGSSRSVHKVSVPDFKVRSKTIVSPMGVCLFSFQSMPFASNPAWLRAAVNRALPQQSSSALACPWAPQGAN